MKREDKVLLILLVLSLLSHFATAQVDNQFQYNWLKPQTFDENIDVKDTVKSNIITNPNIYISRQGIYLDSGHFMLRAGFNNRYHTTRNRQGLQVLTNAQAGDTTGFIINGKYPTVFQHASNSNPITFKFQGTPAATVLTMHSDTIVIGKDIRFKGALYDVDANIVGNGQGLVANADEEPKATTVIVPERRVTEINFPSIPANNSSEMSVLMPCDNNDGVKATAIGTEIEQYENIVITSHIQTDGEVVVRATNVGGQTVDPDPIIFTIIVMRMP